MYKLSLRAVKDIESIYEYTLLNFGECRADKYTNDLESCLEILAESPFIGRESNEIRKGIRRHDFQKHSIFYRVRELDVFIIRILHQQMYPALHF
ncbi:type II toxin-antitoxin system RelE/ParE family toxin [Vibrio sp. JC009]|uniref:type II toxin-antitoxin system RelE/ParE family toxin n=1 Tax=Vibrio sp. JC009 TaxID=2912314 RepID=UPI0023AF3009|nr:type II toxin-antitoxin system RelE/ParE family toxin [Vibrio sp. JC009]WED22047.1 type II toxin-antitoxin system RelE/ParE family toxin [Vibrio sp. JC009]